MNAHFFLNVEIEHGSFPTNQNVFLVFYSLVHIFTVYKEYQPVGLLTTMPEVVLFPTQDKYLSDKHDHFFVCLGGIHNTSFAQLDTRFDLSNSTMSP